MNKKTAIIIAVAATVVISTISYFVIKANDIIPSEKRMAQIMSDIYLADAIAQTKGNLYGTAAKSDKTVENTYHTILTHYGINKQIYDSALVWYSNHPDKYARVYEKIVNIISQKEGDFKVILAQRDSIEKVISRKRDSITVKIEKRSRYIHLPLEERDSIKNKDLKFTYELDSIKGGKIEASMRYIFPRKNEATKAPSFEIIVVYNDTIADTTSVTMQLGHIQKTAELTYDVRKDIPAVKLQATLVKSPEFKKVVATLNEINITYIPYDIRDSVKFDEILLPPLLSY